MGWPRSWELTDAGSEEIDQKTVIREQESEEGQDKEILSKRHTERKTQTERM